ncbi:NYN domain-containing protein [Patescibacteria group bacterium]|nr:NYN domain-containing protein [Patescibacteria group bacterium]
MKIAVFIDNSNIFHRISDIRKTDKNWVSFYNPLNLARKLSGERELAYVGFYCVQPPMYLLNGNEEEKRRYIFTKRYYSAIEKLDLVEIKYGDLKGTKGNLQEKNLDTQLATDLVAMAALNKYDVAIIVSNDGDYISAVKNVKIFKKGIELFFFRGSISMGLKNICDISRRARRSHFQELIFDKNINLDDYK